MGLHVLTGQTIWRQRAMQILKWGVVAGLCFFGLIILRRAAVFISRSRKQNGQGTLTPKHGVTPVCGGV